MSCQFGQAPLTMLQNEDPLLQGSRAILSTAGKKKRKDSNEHALIARRRLFCASRLLFVFSFWGGCTRSALGATEK